MRKGLIRNMKDFILEVGKDFTLINKEYRVQVGEKLNEISFSPLFYLYQLPNCMSRANGDSGQHKSIIYFNCLLDGLHIRFGVMGKRYIQDLFWLYFTYPLTSIASLKVRASSKVRRSRPNFFCIFSNRYTRVLRWT